MTTDKRLKHTRIPRFIAIQYGGAQKFRVAHRASLRKLRFAIGQARLGCAYSGDMKLLQKAERLIEEAIEHCRPSNWERRKS